MNNGSLHLKTHLLDNARGRLTFLLLPVACALFAFAVGSMADSLFLAAAGTCIAFGIAGGASAWTMLDDTAACAVERAYEILLPVGTVVGVAAHLYDMDAVMYGAGAVALSGLGFLAGITPICSRIVHEPHSPRYGVAAMRGAAALQIVFTVAVVALAEPLVMAGIGGILFAASAALYALGDDRVTHTVAMD